MIRRGLAGLLAIGLAAGMLGGWSSAAKAENAAVQPPADERVQTSCGAREIEIGYVEEAAPGEAQAARPRLTVLRVNGEEAGPQDRAILAVWLASLDSLDEVEVECGGLGRPMTLKVSGRRRDAPVETVYAVERGRLAKL